MIFWLHIRNRSKNWTVPNFWTVYIRSFVCYWYCSSIHYFLPTIQLFFNYVSTTFLRLVSSFSRRLLCSLNLFYTHTHTHTHTHTQREREREIIFKYHRRLKVSNSNLSPVSLVQPDTLLSPLKTDERDSSGFYEDGRESSRTRLIDC